MQILCFTLFYFDHSILLSVPEEMDYGTSTNTLSYQPSSQMVRTISFDSATRTTTEHERKNCFWTETKSSSTVPKMPRRWCNSNDTLPKAPMRRRPSDDDAAECNISPVNVLPDNNVVHLIPAQICLASHDCQTVSSGRAHAA
jgi:hypothetical protein